MDPHSETFRSFADTLLVGVLICLASLPLITAFAGFSAGVAVLGRARRDDSHVSLRSFGRTFLQKLRLWFSHVLVPTIVLMVLVIDFIVLPHLLGSQTLGRGVAAVVAVGILTFGLRFAAAADPELSYASNVRSAYRAAGADPGGTLLLAGAVVTAGLLVSISPVLAIVVAGPVALAAVTVQMRTGTGDQ